MCTLAYFFWMPDEVRKRMRSINSSFLRVAVRPGGHGLGLSFNFDDRGFAEIIGVTFFIPGFHLPPNFGVIRERLAGAKDVGVFRREPMAAVPQVAHIRIQFWEVTGDE